MKAHLISTPLSTNKHLVRWVEKMADLTKPAAIHWVDGSKEEYDALCAQMVEGGTFIRLNRDLVAGLLFSALGRRAMSRASKTARSSARCQRKMPGRRTTGSIRLRCGAS